MWSQDEFPSNARVVSVEFDDGFAFLSQQRNKYNIPNHTFQSRYDLSNDKESDLEVCFATLSGTYYKFAAQKKELIAASLFFERLFYSYPKATKVCIEKGGSLYGFFAFMCWSRGLEISKDASKDYPKSEQWPICALQTAELYGSAPTIVEVLREMSIPATAEVEESFFASQAKELQRVLETVTNTEAPQAVWGRPNKKRHLAKMQFRYDFGKVLRADDSIAQNVKKALSNTVAKLYPTTSNLQNKALSTLNLEISQLRREMVAVKQENKTLDRDLTTARQELVAARQDEGKSYEGQITSLQKTLALARRNLQDQKATIENLREQSRDAAAANKQEVSQLCLERDEATKACQVLFAVSSVLNQEMLQLRDSKSGAEKLNSQLGDELVVAHTSLKTALASVEEDEGFREENARLKEDMLRLRESKQSAEYTITGLRARLLKVNARQKTDLASDQEKRQLRKENQRLSEALEEIRCDLMSFKTLWSNSTLNSSSQASTADDGKDSTPGPAAPKTLEEMGAHGENDYQWNPDLWQGLIV